MFFVFLFFYFFGLYQDNAHVAVDHKKFVILVRNAELVWEVHKRLGPATASIYQIVLDQVQSRLRDSREDLSGWFSQLKFLTAEMSFATADIAVKMPDPSLTSSFLDLVDPSDQTSRPSLTNGSTSRRGRRIEYDSDNENFPEVKINGIHRGTSEEQFQKRIEIVAEHLQSLAAESTVFIHPSNASDSDTKEFNTQWTVNLLDLQQYVRQSEMERIIERKYGSDALRLVRLVAEKHHVDQDQVLSSSSPLTKVRKVNPIKK